MATTTTSAPRGEATSLNHSSASSEAFISRSVNKIVEAVETAEGAGATVRRSIGTPQLRNLSPFLMLDHFKIGEGAGFPDHPHRGQSTITYMLEGQVNHEDFAGHAGTIGPGDLQWMLAGRGIVHAEMPKHYDDSGARLPDPVGLQLWVDLPEAAKESEPQYQEMKGTEILTARPRPGKPEETEGSAWAVKVIAGRSHGVESPVRTPANGGTWYLDIRLQPGGRMFQEIPANWTSFIYHLGPAPVHVGDSDSSKGLSRHGHAAYHTLVLSEDAGANGVWLEHAGTESDGEARLMLFAAQKLDQEIYQYGPFVVAHRDDIRRAISDYQLGQNGFERAPGFRSKIGGL